MKAADEMTVWLNNVLSIAHDIGIDGNWKLFVKVVLPFLFSCKADV